MSQFQFEIIEGDDLVSVTGGARAPKAPSKPRKPGGGKTQTWGEWFRSFLPGPTINVGDIEGDGNTQNIGGQQEG